ncbi:hypothetical protein [Agriterribacter sp.]|uniref:hypothetical protein n=1 Tax=Agriterribacter sp. TaxID=2821509 RepID=UPI002BEB8B12|nr:hypothetical protein [Agriterribacter sp.]HRO46890.1 hypothetical protein [Agriterribacter sp.]HRQ17384.1 hypothetical protein [Agriterribacter sp.]
MKKIMMLLVVITTALTQTTYAQDKPEEPSSKGFDKSKLFFGGNFGLGFGSNTSSIIVSPQAGYRFNTHFAAGAGINFNYYSYTTYWSSVEAKTRSGYTGLNIFGRVYPIPYILIQAQPEVNYSWGSIKYADNSPTEKLKGQFVPSLLIGGGAAIPTGGNGALLLMLQYDVLQESRSPYGNKPFFTMGYNF